MKNQVLAALVLLNSISALANPFDKFVGTFVTEGDGAVQNDKMIECYWMYFNGIYALNIAKKTDETYHFALTTKLGGSDVSTSYELSAYNYSVSQGEISTASFSGDANTAIYQVIRTAPQVNESVSWAITQKEGKYFIALTYQRNTESCRYESELKIQTTPAALAPYFALGKR